ncbi:sigma-70 family RNA polymerase sigma factor [Microcoleus sp. C2C3]|uniref:sigma-70 family RNA polymerase sigma factor n=1 Tax=unclassified Microcoleus TaxID=2642155 RepID=UPI002FCFC90A
MMVPATTNHILTPTQEHQLLQRLAAGEINAFWQIFQQHRDYLFRCCLKWMNGNSTEAEDLLSQAMVKAWEKAQKYAGKIDNFKCWLTTLTRNFWIDLTRRRGANQVEDIEVYGEQDEVGLVSVEETPASALDCDEKKRVIRAAIDDLPTRLRETFILHFYEELSHQEIADRQNITYQNVCKRISQARAILAVELRGYFIGEEGTEPDTANVAAKPAKPQKTQKMADRVEPILPETVTLSEQLEKEEKTKTGLAATSAGTEPTIEEISEGNAEVEAGAGEPVTLSVAIIAEVGSVGGEELPFVAQSEQHSESDSVAATADGKLEVRRDGCRCVEVTLGERELAPILALAQLAQLDEETGSWGSSYVSVLWRWQHYQVGKVVGELVRSSRSPPYCFPYFQSNVHDSVGDDDEVKVYVESNFLKLALSKGNFWRCLIMGRLARSVWNFAIY